MFLWVWLACSAGKETGGGLETAGADTAGGDTGGDIGDPLDVPAFAYLYPALGESCGGCHVSEYIGAFFVDGDLEATHDRLLTQAPIGDPDARYVVPGDAAASLLLQKLDAAPPFGESMPPEESDAPPLDPVMADALRAWVEGGAPLP